MVMLVTLACLCQVLVLTQLLELVVIYNHDDGNPRYPHLFMSGTGTYSTALRVILAMLVDTACSCICKAARRNACSNLSSVP